MKPGIIKHDVRKFDVLNQKELDRIEINQNMYLEYHGGSSQDEITIIPVEIQINFLGGFRKGIGSRNGHSQEFASEWLHPFKIEMKNCQKVKGKNLKVGNNYKFESRK